MLWIVTSTSCYNYGSYATKICILCFSFTSFFVRKIFSCSKLMMLNNFVIYCFLVSCTVFVIKTLTQNFVARLRRKWFHCVAQDHFTVPRPHFYDFSSFYLEIVGVATHCSGNTVYASLFIGKFIEKTLENQSFFFFTVYIYFFNGIYRR